MGQLELAIDNRDEGHHQIANAFAFSKDVVYAVLEVLSPDPSAAVLVEIDLRKGLAYKELLELPSFSLNYFAEHAGLHYVIDKRSQVHRVADGKVTVHRPKTKSELSGIARVSATAIALLGEKGSIFVLEGDAFVPIPTGTKERILAAHFVRPDLAFAVGTNGTFLKGDVKGFAPVSIPADTFAVEGAARSRHDVVSVHGKEDGTVLLGTHEGPAFVYEDGVMTRLDGLPEEETVQTIGVFKGIEHWGVAGDGIFGRSGRKLAMRYPTGGAMNINTSQEAMTLVAGSYLYVFDGKDWVEISYNLDLDNLLERIPLDFEPSP